MSNYILKNFIVIEGIDGCGKTTQVKKLKEWLEKEYGAPCTTTAEPSSSPIGKFVREKILSGEETVNRSTLAKLFVLDREEHLYEIKKLVKEGHFVICDRYIKSNIAYQGGGDLEKEKLVANYNKKFPTPLATIYLRVDPADVKKIFTERVEHRENTAKEIFDQIDTQITLAKSYDRLFEGTHSIIVDATKDADTVFNQIVKKLKPLLDDPTKKEFSLESFLRGFFKQTIHYYKTLTSSYEWNTYTVLNTVQEAVENLFHETGLVTLERCNDKLLLWALNPMELGKRDLWSNLSEWARYEYNMTLAIGQYDPLNPQKGEDIIRAPRNFINTLMKELWNEADDEIF